MNETHSPKKEKTPAQTTYLTYYRIIQAFRKQLIDLQNEGVKSLEIPLILDFVANLETLELESQQASRPKE